MAVPFVGVQVQIEQERTHQIERARRVTGASNSETLTRFSFAL
jgi:hypothetical protein